MEGRITGRQYMVYPVLHTPEGNQKLLLPEWQLVVVVIPPAEQQRYRVRTT